VLFLRSNQFKDLSNELLQKNGVNYLFCVMTTFAQKDTLSLMNDDIHQVYNYNKKLDIPLTAVATGISIFNFLHIYSKDRTLEEEILTLNKNDVNQFD